MPSRLSSLLVRDGLVGVKRMEKAFQRQVIYGGSLDTILLEMNLIPEERLLQYLALASGLPPAARDEGGAIAPEAVALISRDLAQQFRALPLSLDGEAVRVLVCSPLEISELEDLADLLDRPLQPLITPEYRWHLVFAAAYGEDPPARFTTLARQVEAEATPVPVGRARSVIIEEPADRPERPSFVSVPAPAATPVIAPVPADDKTIRMDAPPMTPATTHRPTLIGVAPARTTDPGFGIVVPRTPTTPGLGIIHGVEAVPEVATDSTQRRHESVPSPVPRHTPSQPIETAGRDGPLAVVAAREQLATADDRDTVFLTLLRAVRTRARYAGLLTVQGGAAIGRVALAEPEIDTHAIQKVLIPLDVVSPFRAVVHNQQPHIGSLVSGDPGIDAMVMRFGGTMPPSALVMPLILRERVVGVVIAHRVHSDIRLADVTELLPLAAATADALGRLIVRHKAAGYRAPEDAPKAEIEGDLVDTKKMVRPDNEWRAPAPAERPSLPTFESGTELSITAEPPMPIDEVLDSIERAREGQADDGIADAVERASEALAALMRRFPGKLRVDRFAVTGRAMRASQYGGLLELVIRLGGFSAELLVEKMAAPQRDVRFYATVCAAELRPRSAVYALVERLFDQDYGVRATAIEGLAGYPMHDLSQAMARARRALHSTDPETVAAAAAAVVSLGDVEAIGDLISAVERGDRAADHARKSLIALTAHDFGANERRWQKWWEAARRRHRIEWLIEGLSHKEDTIREGAINDLRRLTGEYFGYHHDLPRKERELAAQRWSVWWRETGQRRFEFPDDERMRPTGVLPVRYHHEE